MVLSEVAVRKVLLTPQDTVLQGHYTTVMVSSGAGQRTMSMLIVVVPVFSEVAGVAGPLQSSILMRSILLLLFVPILYTSAHAQFVFTDATTGDLLTPIRSWGASWVDFDGDGDSDIFLSNQATTGGNVLYRNSGSTFEAIEAGDLTADTTPGSLGHSWADYDNDGDLDVYAVGGWISGPGHLFRNEGGAFAIVDEAPIAPADDNRGWSAAWGDIDRDGFVDLVVVHPAGFVGSAQPNHLFQNDGDGSFSRVSDGPIVTGLEPYTIGSWSDYDMDGDLDLFIGSGPTNQPGLDNLYENDGTGIFTRIMTDPIATDLRDGQIMNWVDYDNDGDLDLFVTNFAAVPTNDLYRNDGGGTYVPVTEGPLVNDSGGTSLANTWGDLDNDGDLDVLVTTGGGGLDRLYANDGDGTFTRITDQPVGSSSTTSSGAALSDYDSDGDLDIVVTSQIAGGGPVRLYRNDSANGNTSFQVKLAGVTSNAAGIGARLRATATIFGQSVTMLRDVSSQSTFAGQNDLTVHFGLGDATVIDLLEIEWPSGSIDTYADVDVAAFGGIAIAVEDQEILPVANEQGSRLPSRTSIENIAPNPFSTSTTIEYALTSPSDVSLVVYDVLGREITRLVMEQQAAGTHTSQLEAKDLPSGLYVIRMDHANGGESRTVTLTR